MEAMASLAERDGHDHLEWFAIGAGAGAVVAFGLATVTLRGRCAPFPFRTQTRGLTQWDPPTTTNVPVVIQPGDVTVATNLLRNVPLEQPITLLSGPFPGACSPGWDPTCGHGNGDTFWGVEGGGFIRTFDVAAVPGS